MERQRSAPGLPRIADRLARSASSARGVDDRGTDDTNLQPSVITSSLPDGRHAAFHDALAQTAPVKRAVTLAPFSESSTAQNNQRRDATHHERGGSAGDLRPRSILQSKIPPARQAWLAPQSGRQTTPTQTHGAASKQHMTARLRLPAVNISESKQFTGRDTPFSTFRSSPGRSTAAVAVWREYLPGYDREKLKYRKIPMWADLLFRDYLHTLCRTELSVRGMDVDLQRLGQMLASSTRVLTPPPAPSQPAIDDADSPTSHGTSHHSSGAITPPATPSVPAATHVAEVLESVELDGCTRLDGSVFTLVGGCPRLRALSVLRCPQLQATDYQLLTEHCSRIESLRVGEVADAATGTSGGITSHVLKRIVHGDTFPRLHTIALRKSSLVSDFVLHRLATSRTGSMAYRLCHIDLTGADAVSANGVVTLLQSCRGLESLQLRGCRSLDDSAFSPLQLEPYSAAERSSEKHRRELQVRWQACVSRLAQIVLTEVTMAAIADSTSPAPDGGGVPDTHRTHGSALTTNRSAASRSIFGGSQRRRPAAIDWPSDAKPPYVPPRPERLSNEALLANALPPPEGSITSSLDTSSGDPLGRPFNRRVLTEPDWLGQQLVHADRCERFGFAGRSANRLTEMVLDGAVITDSTLKWVADSLPLLLKLSLRKCRNISGTGLNALASGCLFLEELDLTDCMQLTDSDMRTLGWGACEGVWERQQDSATEYGLSPLHVAAVVRNDEFNEPFGMIPFFETSRQSGTLPTSAPDASRVGHLSVLRTNEGWIRTQQQWRVKLLARAERIVRQILRRSSNRKTLAELRATHVVSVAQRLAEAAFDPSEGGEDTRAARGDELFLLDDDEVNLEHEEVPVRVASLRRVNLTGCYKVTDRGVQQLCRRARRLQTLTLDGLNLVGDKAVVAVAKYCTRLQSLSVSGRLNMQPTQVKAASATVNRARHASTRTVFDAAPAVGKTAEEMEASITAAAAKALPGVGEGSDSDGEGTVGAGGMPPPKAKKTGSGGGVATFFGIPRVTGCSLAQLVSSVPSVQDIYSSRLNTITDEGVDLMAAGAVHAWRQRCGPDWRNTKGHSPRPLRAIHAIGAQLTDAALVSLSAWPHLQVLHLARCDGVTSRGVSALARGCRMLRELSINGCENVGGDAIQLVGTYCQRLRVLSVRGLYRLTDPVVAMLSENLLLLQELDMRECDSISRRNFERSCAAFICGQVHPRETRMIPRPAPELECAARRFTEKGAAISIQRWARAIQQKSMDMEERIRRAEIRSKWLRDAAGSLQRFIRGFLDRRFVARLRVEAAAKQQRQLELKLARFQAVWRGHKGRLYVTSLRRAMQIWLRHSWRRLRAGVSVWKEQWRHNAAKVIQRWARGSLATQINWYARQIQRVVRGHLGRLQGKQWLRYHNGVVTSIQRVWRGALTRRQYEREGVEVMRIYAEMRVAYVNRSVVRIQRKWRAHSFYSLAIYHIRQRRVAATMLQATRRGLLGRRQTVRRLVLFDYWCIPPLLTHATANPRCIFTKGLLMMQQRYRLVLDKNARVIQRAFRAFAVRGLMRRVRARRMELAARATQLQYWWKVMQACQVRRYMEYRMQCLHKIQAFARMLLRGRVAWERERVRQHQERFNEFRDLYKRQQGTYLRWRYKAYRMGVAWRIARFIRYYFSWRVHIRNHKARLLMATLRVQRHWHRWQLWNTYRKIREYRRGCARKIARWYRMLAERWQWRGLVHTAEIVNQEKLQREKAFRLASRRMREKLMQVTARDVELIIKMQRRFRAYLRQKHTAEKMRDAEVGQMFAEIASLKRKAKLGLAPGVKLGGPITRLREMLGRRRQRRAQNADYSSMDEHADNLMVTVGRRDSVGPGGQLKPGRKKYLQRKSIRHLSIASLRTALGSSNTVQGRRGSRFSFDVGQLGDGEGGGGARAPRWSQVSNPGARVRNEMGITGGAPAELIPFGLKKEDALRELRRREEERRVNRMTTLLAGAHGGIQTLDDLVRATALVPRLMQQWWR